jgi:fibronectin-binding autotransporter adhesin
VSGRFDDWRVGGTSPLFITGDLNYDADDVWFLATRVSTTAALSASGIGDKLTLDSAGHVDAAFGGADKLIAGNAALAPVQQDFLRSAAVLQRIDDLDVATHSFDSLSGHGYVAAAQAIAQQGFAAASELAQHAAGVQPGTSRAWRSRGGVAAANSGDFHVGQQAGVDRWLSSRWLVGSRVGQLQGELAFDRMGGQAGTRAPTAQAYVRHNGDDGRYAFGSVGVGLHRVELTRGIDLGAGARPASSEQDYTLLHGAFETGRDMAVGGGRLSAFAAVDYSALRGAGFTELGGTGFELHANASLLQEAAAGVGLRYARRWQGHGESWWQLGVDARYQPRLWSSGTVEAAFTGMPDIGFRLFDPGAGYAPAAGALRLAGGRQRLLWQLQAGRFGGQDAVSADVTFSFR